MALKGEVYFPNVQFEKTIIDFGCILNDTEVTRYVNMTNNSPMDVHYKWSFLLDDEPVIKFNRPSPPPVEEELMKLEVSMRRGKFSSSFSRITFLSLFVMWMSLIDL